MGLKTDIGKSLKKDILKHIPLGGTLGKVAGAVGDALGLGKTEADKRRDREREFTQKAIRECSLPHLLKTIKPQAEGGTRWPGLRKGAEEVDRLRKMGYSCSAVQRMWATGGADMRNGRPYEVSDNQPGDRPWQSSSSTATTPSANPATPSSTPQPTQGQGTGSAPRAPRACKFGPRGADGYCPPRPKKSASSTQGQGQGQGQAQGFASSSRPCKYGPRQADGYCPPRPAGGGSSSPRSQKPCKYGPRGADGYCPTKAQSQLGKKLEREVTTGLTSAAQKVLKTVGVGRVLAVVGRASLVAGAGLAAYWLTTQAQKLRWKTWEDIKYGVALASIEAKRKAAEQLGRPLTNDELTAFGKYYKSRMAMVDDLIARGESPTHFDPVPFVFED